MTAVISLLDSSDAYDLLFPEHSSTLSKIEQETIQRAIMNSAKVWAGKDDAEVIAMWGLIPPTLMSDVAYLWLFTTKHLTSRRMMFLRHSRKVVRQMLEDFPHIVGHCACAAPRSQQWLRWLGAEFGDPINNDFIPFTIRARQWQQDSAQ